MSALSHQAFQSQIAQSATLLAGKTHPEDRNTLKSIEVVASFYGEGYKVLAGLSHLGQTFAAVGQYHIAKWLKKPNFKTLKKISTLQKDWAISKQDNKILIKHYAFPEDRRIFLSYIATANESRQLDGIMRDWQFNITSSLFHETGHLIEHAPIITPKNLAWKQALAKLRAETGCRDDETQCIANAIEHTIKTLPEEMFADCFAILSAELTGWGDRATIAKETSIWRQQMAHPKKGQEEAELAWMSHYTHTACDLLAQRTEVVKDTRDAKKLAGLVAWEAWNQLQDNMEKELWFFKTLGLGQGNQSFSDFIAGNTQKKTILPQDVAMEEPAPRSVSLKPFRFARSR